MKNTKELIDLLHLDDLENNTFSGKSVTIGSAIVFGGQVLAQAVNAAYRTIPTNRFLHSLHAYFLEAGDLTTDIQYHVTEMRNGGSFSTRRITATQHDKTIFIMAASFHQKEEGFEHQISNALACAAVGTALGFSIDSIATALSTALIESKWRMEIHEFSEVLLINDSYNASPDAVEAALRTLILFAQERGGRAWAFLGKMAELGESSALAHQQVGTLAYQMGIDHLVCVDAPEYQPAEHSAGQTNLHLCDRSGARSIAEQIEPGDVILVKASRSERFEILAEEIEEVVKRKITAGGEEE